MNLFMHCSLAPEGLRLDSQAKTLIVKPPARGQFQLTKKEAIQLAASLLLVAGTLEEE